MTRDELCEACAAPPDAAPAELVSAWERRRAEVAGALEGGALAKPVRLRLRTELSRLDAAEGVAAELRAAAQIEEHLREAERERAGPAPSPALHTLALDKARALLPRLTDEALRYGFERRLAIAQEALALRPAPAGACDPADVPTPRAEARGAGVDAAAEADLNGLTLVAPQVTAPPLVTSRSLATLQAGLEITPLASNGAFHPAPPALRFLARPVIALGRRSDADLVTRFLPESDENKERSATISRLNATLTASDGQIWLRDGAADPVDGSWRPSTNGTSLDDRAVTGPVALDLSGERRIRLGQFGFEVRARRLAPPAADRLSGCVRLSAHPNGVTPPTFLLWMLTDCALGSGSDCAPLAFTTPLPELSARLHFRSGRYWLETPARARGPNAAVCLDGKRRPPGDVAALRTGHRLTLGHNEYEIRITG